MEPTINRPKTLLEAIAAYGDLDFSLAESVESRWPGGVACTHCGADSPMFLKTRRVWKCSKCRKQFSFKAGTVLEDSPIGLDKWLPAIWLIANDRNGISSHELARALGVTQKTAWFMLHRIRLAMQDSATGGKLGGPMGSEVEVDETYIGGAARNMHKNKKASVMKGRRGGSAHKAIVLGVLERKGKVRARVIENTTNPEMRAFVKANVEFGSRVHSDEAGERWGMDQHYIHEMVNHSAEEYVRGNVHCNGIENFWSLLKRGISGTYISVEPFHLFRYVDEQAFRFNNRKYADGKPVSDYIRFKVALTKVVGKRITYKELIGKAKG
ncbi:MAG TPA: IS1595 family transposase [Bryobacteraceae bacterium]|nr:IS1595 family transposase [Bryobacteraceae bacterium]